MFQIFSVEGEKVVQSFFSVFFFVLRTKSSQIHGMIDAHGFICREGNGANSCRARLVKG